MPFELLWLPEADEAMARIEADGTLDAVRRSLVRTLGRMELDPFDSRLGTRQFRTEGYEHVRATPAGFDDWWVLWRLGDDEGTVIVIHVGEIAL